MDDLLIRTATAADIDAGPAFWKAAAEGTSRVKPLPEPAAENVTT